MKNKIIVLCIGLISIFFLTSCTNTKHKVTFLDEYDEVITEIYVSTGSKIELTNEILEISKPGYKLKGWYLETAKWKFDKYRVFTDIKLRAEWEKKKSVIYFDLGPGAKLEPIECEAGERIVLPIPTRDDFEFGWWELDDKKLPLSIDSPNEDITLKAIWQFDSSCWRYKANEVTSYIGNSKFVYVPYEYALGNEKRYITNIGGTAFQANQNIEEVILADGIKYISSLAFMQASNLKKVTLSNDITILNWGTFQDCINLEEVKLPENLQLIGRNCFANCLNLKTLIIPRGVSLIEERAISNCPNTIIYVCAEEKPDNWHDFWYENIEEIVWGYTEK